MSISAKLWTAIFILGAGFAAPAAARSGENGRGFTYGAEFDVNTRYVWRGLAWSQGAAWQPSLWAGRSGLELSLWTNFPLGDEPTRHKFNEVDFRLSYTKEWGAFSFVPAFNIYSYPNQDKEDNPTTGEIELAAAYAFAPFTLATTHVLDVWDNPGGYLGEVALEFEEEPSDRLTFQAAVRLTFANARFHAYYVPVDKSAMSALAFEVGLTFDLGSGLTLRPHAEWTRLLDPDVRMAVAVSDWVFSGRASLFNLGIALGVEF